MPERAWNAGASPGRKSAVAVAAKPTPNLQLLLAEARTGRVQKSKARASQ